MKIENHVPNFLTLCNLFCGFLGLLACFYGELALGGSLVIAGAIFDVFDGMAARLLKVHNPIGKQLDSLADVVTFGMLPATIAHLLMAKSGAEWVYAFYLYDIPLIPLLPFLFVAAAALRLAKFNVDETQSKVFRGLPTPAAGLVFASLPLMAAYDPFILFFNTSTLIPIVTNAWIISALIIIISWLMLSSIPLHSFKSGGKFMYVLIGIGILLAAGLLFAAVPVIIFLYVILSLIFKPGTDEVSRAN